MRTGLVRKADQPGGFARSRALSSATEVIITSRVDRSRSSRSMAFTRGSPSIPSMCMSRIATAIGAPRAAAPMSPESAEVPSVASSTSAPQAESWARSTSRLVELPSATRMGVPTSCEGPGRSALVSSTLRIRAVNRNSAPFPTSLFTPIRPPMSSTS